MGKLMVWFSSKIPFSLSLDQLSTISNHRAPARWRTSVVTAGTTGPVNHYCRHGQQPQPQPQSQPQPQPQQQQQTTTMHVWLIKFVLIFNLASRLYSLNFQRRWKLWHKQAYKQAWRPWLALWCLAGCRLGYWSWKERKKLDWKRAFQ